MNNIYIAEIIWTLHINLHAIMPNTCYKNIGGEGKKKYMFKELHEVAKSYSSIVANQEIILKLKT